RAGGTAAGPPRAAPKGAPPRPPRTGRRRAAAGAAGGVAVAKWVAGAAVMRIVVDGAQGSFLHVELAQNDRTLCSKPAHDLRIGAGRRMCAAEAIAGRHA